MKEWVMKGVMVLYDIQVKSLLEGLEDFFFFFDILEKSRLGENDQGST